MGCGQANGGLREETPPPPRAGLPVSPTPQSRHLLAVGITEGQAKVVLLQEVEVLTDQVKQHLAPAVFLKRRAELP